MLRKPAVPPGDRPRRPASWARSSPTATACSRCAACSTRAGAGSRSRRRTRARAAAPPGYDDIAWIARLLARRLPRAVPVGEQLAASEPAPGAVERGDARLGPRLHAATAANAAQGARRQPGRALRLRAARRHVNCDAASAFAWTTPETSSSSPRPAAPASRAWSRRCSSSTRTSRSSVSHTTRTPRGQEKHGREYHFVDEPTFRAMVAARRVRRVGPGARPPLRHLARRDRGADRPAAHDVLLEIDWQGALQIKRLFPNAVLIFILPPSWDELRSRLERRGEDDAEVDRAAAWPMRATRWRRPGSSTSL